MAYKPNDFILDRFVSAEYDDFVDGNPSNNTHNFMWRHDRLDYVPKHIAWHLQCGVFF